MLIAKCRHYGVPEKAIAFLEAYLAGRSAKVVVEGDFSEAFSLIHQVFQGIVLGPYYPFGNLRKQSCQVHTAVVLGVVHRFLLVNRNDPMQTPRARPYAISKNG